MFWGFLKLFCEFKFSSYKLLFLGFSVHTQYVDIFPVYRGSKVFFLYLIGSDKIFSLVTFVFELKLLALKKELKSSELYFL